jgi:glycerophosphoryl diester phosphodiesterase
LPEEIHVSLRVVAHRGASGEAPENSWAALVRARDCGATWVEVDVQRTSDGVLVLVHDDSWLRTAAVDRTIASTRWADVADFDVGRWFAPAYAGERVPTLDGVLAQTDLCFDLEIKSPERHPGLASEIVTMIRRHGAQHRVVLTCFDPEVVEDVATQAPDLRAGYLAAHPLGRTHPAVRVYAIEAGVLLGHAGYAAELRRRGAEVWVWTVDDPALGNALAAAGAQAVITNYPARWLDLGARRAEM